MNSAETSIALANIKERLDKVEILVLSDNPYTEMLASLRDDVRFLLGHIENLPPAPIDDAKNVIIAELQEQIDTYSSVSGQLLILLSTTLDTSSKFASTLRATEADLGKLFGASFSLQSMISGQPTQINGLVEELSHDPMVDQPAPPQDADTSPNDAA